SGILSISAARSRARRSSSIVNLWRSETSWAMPAPLYGVFSYKGNCNFQPSCNRGETPARGRIFKSHGGDFFRNSFKTIPVDATPERKYPRRAETLAPALLYTKQFDDNGTVGYLGYRSSPDKSERFLDSGLLPRRPGV